MSESRDQAIDRLRSTEWLNLSCFPARPLPGKFQQIETDYPQIDTDPHFKTVVRYFRPSDYMTWGGMTVGGPAFLYMFGEYRQASSELDQEGELRSTWYRRSLI